MIYHLQAKAKINIGLSVYKLRQGANKHQIESLFMLIDDYADEITLEHANSLDITYIINNRKTIIANDSILKSVEFLQEHFNIDIDYKITIKKHIPQQAGLGGSSADAGAIIKFFKEHHHLEFTKQEYRQIALELGSDIPFFISGYKMALVSGYGHLIKPITKPCPDYQIIPNKLASDTKKIYAAFDKLRIKQDQTKYKKIIKCLPNIKDCIIINNLELPAFYLEPTLGTLKKDGYHLTGSGAYFVKFYNKGETHEN